MNKLLFYLLESGAGLLVFYLLYILVLKRENGFVYNRFYLLVTPLLALGLPLVELPFLRQPEPLTILISEQFAPLTISAKATAPGPDMPLLNWKTGLLLLYGAGTGFFIFRLLRQLYRLRQFTRQTRADRFYWQNIPVHQTHGAQPTFSFGNVIFYDNSQPLTKTETERILLHEAVHVRQKHTLDILYLEVVSILFWFNPLLYFYKKALISTHEFTADAAVLQTTAADAYATLLAKQLFHRLEFSFGHYFNKSLTLKRMHMLKQTHRRPSKLKQLLALPILGILLFILACAETETPTTPEVNSSALKELSAPQFPGGRKALYEYLVKNIKYPSAGAIAKDEEMLIVTAVTIGKNGQVIKQETEPNDDDFSKEVKRLINNMPDWKPATKAGELIESNYELAFIFSPKGLMKDEPLIDTRKVELLDRPKADLPRFSAGDIVIHNGKDITVGQLDDTASDKEQAQNEPIFTFVEQNPTFPGGLEKMYAFLGKNIKYPVAARKANVEGMVLAKFTVTKEGKIKNLRIEKSLSPETDAETLRIIKMMPDWKPGVQNGRPVNVEYTLPIKFSLADNTSEPSAKSDNSAVTVVGYK